jgi:anti-sigma factor RsiW
MYDDVRFRRLSVVIRPMVSRSHAPQFDMGQSTINRCGWIEDGLRYAVVAEMSDSESDRMAKQIEADVSQRGT